jgi:hypothetical protein
MIMKLKITIDMKSAAFEPGIKEEAARILKSFTQDLEAGNCWCELGDHETLMDLNGNRVGEAKVTR